MQVFRVWPKRIRRGNGQIMSPEMVVVVTMKYHASTPFVNGFKEVKQAFWNIYHCDLNKLVCCSSDFNYQTLG